MNLLKGESSYWIKNKSGLTNIKLVYGNALTIFAREEISSEMVIINFQHGGLWPSIVKYF